MISRARYGIEYIRENYLEYRNWIFNDTNHVRKLSRIFDVNFDMKDVAISQDIIEEWKEDFCEGEYIEVDGQEYEIYSEDIAGDNEYWY